MAAFLLCLARLHMRLRPMSTELKRLRLLWALMPQHRSIATPTALSLLRAPQAKFVEPPVASAQAHSTASSAPATGCPFAAAAAAGRGAAGGCPIAFAPAGGAPADSGAAKGCPFGGATAAPVGAAGGCPFSSAPAGGAPADCGAAKGYPFDGATAAPVAAAPAGANDVPALHR